VESSENKLYTGKHDFQLAMLRTAAFRGEEGGGQVEL
jgi:hypothetical protein